MTRNKTFKMKIRIVICTDHDRKSKQMQKRRLTERGKMSGLMGVDLWSVITSLRSKNKAVIQLQRA